MKKLKSAFNNIYNILIIRNNKSINYRKIDSSESDRCNDLLFEESLKNIIEGDKLNFEADDSVQFNLRNAVRQKRNITKVYKSSFEDIFLSLFSFRNFELKMAAIGIMLICFLGGNNFEDSYKGNFNENGKGKLCDTFPKLNPSRADSVLR